MAPRPEKPNKEHLTILNNTLVSRKSREGDREYYFRIKISQAFPQFRELGRSDEVIVQVLDHDTGKLEILMIR